MGSIYERPLRSDELMHYGVKGMKWGVRKRRENVNRFYSQRDRKRRININGKKVAAGVGAVAGAALAGAGAYHLYKSGQGRKVLESAYRKYDNFRNTKAVRNINRVLDRTRGARRTAGRVLNAIELGQKGKYVYDNRQNLKTKEGRRKMIERQKKTMRTKQWRRKQLGSLAVNVLLNV